MNTNPDHLYTPLENAVTELLRRRREHFSPPVDELDALLAETPSAVLVRQVATPNFETLRFVELAESLGLRPLVLEYGQDLFVTHNEFKLALGLMRFTSAAEDVKERLPQKRMVLDMNRAGGKPLCSVQTLWGQNLAEFHHELFDINGRTGGLTVADMSGWFQQQGGCAQSYYAPVFRALRDRAIQFETYLTKTPSEALFTKDVVMPAFSEVVSEGRKPLICRLDPEELEGAPAWYYYPKALEVITETKLRVIAPTPHRIRRHHHECSALAA